MRLITACLLGTMALAMTAIATPASAEPLIDVQAMYNGDGTWTYWIGIDPNTGLDEDTFIDTTISSNMFNPESNNRIHQWLERDSFGEVHLTSQQGAAIVGDPTYPFELDTVFDDGDFPGVVQVDITPLDQALDFVPAPDPQPSANGANVMRVQAASFAGPGIGGPIRSGEFTPIWHVTTWGPGLWLEGVLQTDSNPSGAAFEWHIPEPSSALLAGMGLALMGVVRRRRK